MKVSQLLSIHQSIIPSYVARAWRSLPPLFWCHGMLILGSQIVVYVFVLTVGKLV